MPMFALNRAILLVGVWAGNTVGDPYIFEIFVESAIFTAPIGLNTLNFLVKKQFNVFWNL
jgi:hypothetical protein